MVGRSACRTPLRGALSTPADDDESGAEARIRPHFPEDRSDLAAIDCDANHGRGVGRPRCVEDLRAPDERVGATGQVYADLVAGCEVVGRCCEGEGEGCPGLPRRLRRLDLCRSGRTERHVQGEEDGSGGQGPAGEGEAPGRAS